MSFYSILYPDQLRYKKPRRTTSPECLRDLNMDQLFSHILKNRADYQLEQFYHTQLQDKESIVYRQQVFQDLENVTIREMVSEYSRNAGLLRKRMDEIRSKLEKKEAWENNYLTRGYMLREADIYCNSVMDLSRKLQRVSLKSVGMKAFKTYLGEYCTSETFLKFQECVEQIKQKCKEISYCIYLKDGTVRVRKYQGEKSQTDRILSLFEKFRQDTVKDYRHELNKAPYAEHIEAEILSMLSEVYPDLFDKLADFCKSYIHFDDEILLLFAKEIQFYLGWLEMTAALQLSGLQFCYPEIDIDKRQMSAEAFFDVALAYLQSEHIVTNDFSLSTPEHIMVVTGPNQGGKTTFARAFGQLHYLASLGVSVPGRCAKLLLCDQVLTHFEREEDITNLNGKLQDELERLHNLEQNATSDSIIIINEIFASTTLEDAIKLGRYMMEWLTLIGTPAVVVTFLDELAEYGPNTVSFMSMVDQNQEHSRSYKVIRKKPDGHAYALDIAEKYGLTYEQLEKRLQV